MPITTDFHSHVAGSSAAQMIESARTRGLRTLGLSEHVFQMEEVRPFLAHMPMEGPIRSFNAYVEEVHTAAQKLSFDARLGLEVDFVPEKNAQI